MHRRGRMAAATAAAVLALAACGGDDTGGEEASSAPASEPAVESESTAASEPGGSEAAAAGGATSSEAGPVEVATADSDLGEIVVDGEGMTLYVFDNDSDGESACYDACAQTWPPLTGSATAGEGVDASLLGETTRDDGTTQVTYDGSPLYYYAPDAAPGDTQGQGVGDVWWVVGPDGAKIEG